MNDQDRLVTLIRLRDLIYFGVRPTLRQCGFPATTIQELAKDHLIGLSDKGFGEEPDRLTIEQILPAGLAFINQQHAAHQRAA